MYYAKLYVSIDTVAVWNQLHPEMHTETHIRLHASNAGRPSLSSSLQRNVRGLEWKNAIYRVESCPAFEDEIIGTHHVRYNSSEGVYFKTGLK